MPITHWPGAERPREKLLLKGAAALSDAELLAIFFRTGTRGRSAVDLARDLVRDYDGLRSLLDADQATLCSAKGIGPTKYVLIQAALELGRRYLQSELSERAAMTNPQNVRDFLSLHLRRQKHEVFAAMFLDNRHRVIEFRTLFRGTINGASVYPREVVKEALALNAAAIIFAHNHPSGVAEPSQADVQITKQLREALELVDINVLDHFIVGDGNAVSFSERGLL